MKRIIEYPITDFYVGELYLYNIHNNQFYNPNEDEFESLSPLAEYLLSNKVSFKSEQTTIPKALRLFKRTM